MPEKVCIVYHDMLTAYGHGLSCCMEALFANRTVFRKVTRFESDNASPAIAACFPLELFPDDVRNTAEASVLYLLNNIPENLSLLADDPVFFFALTQGEISKLENTEKQWTAQLLVKEIMKHFPINSKSAVFSASCASGNIALARAAAEISSGRIDQAVVIGCDVVSEFTYAGFSSVHAIAEDMCRPYDAAHNGLLLGDAVGIIVLASEKKALAIRAMS